MPIALPRPNLKAVALQGYIVFAPWTAWLCLNGWLRPPVECLLLGLLLSLPVLLHRLVNRPGTLIVAEEDWLLLLLAGLAWVSFSMGSGTSKSFNHAFSFTFCYGAFCIIFKRAWLDAGLPLERIFKMALIAVLIGDGIVVIEWTMLNFFDVLIRPWFILSASVSNMDYYDQAFFKSVGGTAEEPSLMCFNVNALFPLGWYYLRDRGRVREAAAFVALHLLTLVFTASSGGIGFLAIGYVAANLLEAKGTSVMRLAITVLAIGVLCVGVYMVLPIELQYKADTFIKQITSKFLFTNRSADMRQEAWSRGWSDFLAAPIFGRGPAYGHEAYRMFGYQSYYFKLLAETGIVSLLTLWVYLAVIFVRVRTLANPLRKYLTISVVASIGHWAIADSYYHVSFWIVISLIQLIYVEKKKAVGPEIASIA